MRVLVAPDKFKGSLSATEVADGLVEGLAGVGAEPLALPLADGGDGSVAAALAAGMRPHRCTVANALGRPASAAIAMSGATAVVEVASTCGLSTLPRGVLAPKTASSYGFGEAICHAIGAGARRVVLALGGSASTDGGSGMLSALGYTFIDEHGRVTAPSAAELPGIRKIRTDNAINLSGVELVIAGDVTNPLLGPNGAARVFGPQKGASPTDVAHLERGLSHLVSVLAESGVRGARTLAGTPGAGAAGGIGFAALSLGGRIVSGADYFLDLLRFDEHVSAADLVVTGEGRLDEQTLAGKLPAAVARRAAPLPVVAVVGRNSLTRPTPMFVETYALADHSDTDTAGDPIRSASLLRRIGAEIGARHAMPGSAITRTG